MYSICVFSLNFALVLVRGLVIHGYELRHNFTLLLELGVMRPNAPSLLVVVFASLLVNDSFICYHVNTAFNLCWFAREPSHSS